MVNNSLKNRSRGVSNPSSNIETAACFEYQYLRNPQEMTYNVRLSLQKYQLHLEHYTTVYGKNLNSIIVYGLTVWCSNWRSRTNMKWVINPKKATSRVLMTDSSGTGKLINVTSSCCFWNSRCLTYMNACSTRSLTWNVRS